MANKIPQLSLSLAASAIALAFGTSAHAGARFVGYFDPQSDGFVPGYQGSAIFDVDLSCLPAGGTGWASTSTLGDCGPVTLESAIVYLGSLNPGDPVPAIPPGTPAPIDFLTFGPGDMEIFGIYVENGELQGVDSTLSVDKWGQNPFPSAYSGPFDGSSGFTFNLRFVSGCFVGDTDVVNACDDLFAPPIDIAGLAPLFDPVPAAQLFAEHLGTDGRAGPLTSNSMTFSRIPEPGTLSLVFGALGAGWLARRRRK